jgi:hypothetical protein
VKADGGVDGREDSVWSGGLLDGLACSVFLVLFVFFVLFAEGKSVEQRSDGAAMRGGLSGFRARSEWA